MSGTVSFTFDADQTWQNAEPTPTSLNGNTAIWDFSALAIGEVRTIHVLLHTDVGVPISTPISHAVVVGPTTDDETASDNTVIVDGLVMGSYRSERQVGFADRCHHR